MRRLPRHLDPAATSLSERHDFEITAHHLLPRTFDGVRLGRYFLYLDDAALLTGGGRRGRLGLSEGGRRVVPLVDEPVEMPGCVLRPTPPVVDPLACVAPDRDLYRAEEDTVYLFVAVPEPHSAHDGLLSLRVEQDRQILREGPIELDDDGVGVEILPPLLAGSYSAQLVLGERLLGRAVHFSVAEHTLAPLSARLVAHQLERRRGTLNLELEVESYQTPYAGDLRAELLEDGQVVTSRALQPKAPGRFRAAFRLRGKGPFRLRLAAHDDAERVTEVALPGTRAAERETTVASELGIERLFSLLPEEGARPLRGGFLSDGEELPTPLELVEPVAGCAVLRAHKAVEDLHLVALDLAEGRFEARSMGDVEIGEEVEIELEGPAITLVAGAFVEGRPFEGFASVFRPEGLRLEVGAPESLRPRDDLEVELRVNVEGDVLDGGRREPIPVLLAVRDQRLSVSQPPSTGLAGSLQRALRDLADGMETGIQPFDRVFYTGPIYRSRGLPRGPVDMPMLGTFERSAGEVVAFAGGDVGLDLHAAAPVAVSLPLGDEGSDVPGDDALDTAPPRTDFPELLFCGLVRVEPGESQSVMIPLGDALTTYAVDAFALADGDWSSVATTVAVDQPVRADLELPLFVHPDDHAIGRLRVASGSGRARVHLERGGERVELRDADGQIFDVGTEVATPIELEVTARPGLYRARVEDAESGEIDVVERQVEIPGRLRATARGLAFLQAGEALDLGGAGGEDTGEILALRVLPSVDRPFGTLLQVTSSYAHLCCEQTAAKILSAVALYLLAKEPFQRRGAEETILAGVAREREMFLPDKGFAMYPGRKSVSSYYSPLTVRYLWALHQLDEVQDLSVALREAVREGLEMASSAARGHGLERVPKAPRSIEEAYAAATGGGDAKAARDFVEHNLDTSGAEVRVKIVPGGSGTWPSHRVADRAFLAYAAATLLAVGERPLALRIANQVLRQLGENGGLYSTLDSAAAIALLTQLSKAGLLGGGRLRVNGREMTTAEAVELGDNVEQVEVLEGSAAVEMTRVLEEDWETLAERPGAEPIRVEMQLLDNRGRRLRHASPGRHAELVVRLPEGYRTGDLVHVCLPPALAWLHGGGRVQRFSVDFEGTKEVRVPLAVTSRLAGPQRGAVVVRNMFEEERVGNPGALAVEP